MRKLNLITLLALIMILFWALYCAGQTQPGAGPLGVFDGGSSFLGYLVDGAAGGPTYVVFNPEIPAFFKVSAVWPNPILKACEGWSYYFTSVDCSGQPYIAIGDSGCGLHYLAHDSYTDAFYIYDPQVPMSSICDFRSIKAATSSYNCAAYNNCSGLSAGAAFPIKQIDIPFLKQALQYPLSVTDMNEPPPPPLPYTLSVTLNPSAGGSVTAIPQKSSYGVNEVVTLTAHPNFGYTFGNWSGDATGSSTSIQVTITKNMTVTANFNPIVSYTLTINLNPFPGGYVLASPQKSSYGANEVVTLTATCYPTYAFGNWSGDASGTDPSIQITMTKNMVVTANFTPPIGYTLSVSPNPPAGGSVTVSPQKGGLYNANDVVTLTANSNNGYGFSSWSGDATGTTTSIQITMTKSMSVTANFVPVPTYTLSISANPPAGGSVTANPQKSSYNENEVVTLTANANTDYVFASWTGDAGGTNPSTQITMTKSMSVTANFTSIPHTLTVNINPLGYGYAILSPAGGSYPAGTKVTITARSNLAFHSFSSWSGDSTGTISGTTNPITITMPSSDIGVTANFK